MGGEQARTAPRTQQTYRDDDDGGGESKQLERQQKGVTLVCEEPNAKLSYRHDRAVSYVPLMRRATILGEALMRLIDEKRKRASLSTLRKPPPLPRGRDLERCWPLPHIQSQINWEATKAHGESSR